MKKIIFLRLKSSKFGGAENYLVRLTDELKKQNISVPVLLGGAALTDNFVEEHCRTNYDGAVFYCKDAFDGITAMCRIEEKNFDTNLRGKESDEQEKTITVKKEKKSIPYSKIKMPNSIFADVTIKMDKTLFESVTNEINPDVVKQYFKNYKTHFIFNNGKIKPYEN